MIKTLLIQALIAHLLKPATRRALADAVAYYADADIPGEQKREAALDLVRSQGVQAANWALNLGLELLVAKYR